MNSLPDRETVPSWRARLLGLFTRTDKASSLVRVLCAALPFSLLKLSGWELPGRSGMPSSGEAVVFGFLAFLVLAAGLSLVMSRLRDEPFDDWFARTSFACLILTVTSFTPVEDTLPKAWFIAVVTHAVLLYALWPVLRSTLAFVGRLPVSRQHLFLGLLFAGVLLRVVIFPLMRHGDTNTMINAVGWTYAHPLTVYEVSRDFRTSIRSPYVLDAEYGAVGLGFFMIVRNLYGPAFHNIDQPTWWKHVELENRYVFFLRLGYLILDLSIAFLLLSFFRSPERGLLAFSLWWLNPISIYVCYIFGQFDIVAGLAVLLCVWAAARGKEVLAAAFLGMGGLVKVVPLFLLPYLAADQKEWGKRLAIVAVGVGVCFLGILPFLGSETFVNHVLRSSDAGSAFAFRIAPYHIVYLFPAALGFYLFYLLTERKPVGPETLAVTFGAIFLATVPTRPQWFMWFLPVMVAVMASRRLPILLVPLVCGFYAYSSFTRGEFLNFRPSSSYLGNVMPIWNQVGRWMDPDMFQSLGYVVVTITCVLLVWRSHASQDTSLESGEHWHRPVLLATRGVCAALVLVVAGGTFISWIKPTEIGVMQVPLFRSEGLLAYRTTCEEEACVFRSMSFALSDVPERHHPGLRFLKIRRDLSSKTYGFRSETRNDRLAVWPDSAMRLRRGEILEVRLKADGDPPPTLVMRTYMAGSRRAPLFDTLRERFIGDTPFAMSYAFVVIIAAFLAAGFLDRRILLLADRESARKK